MLVIKLWCLPRLSQAKLRELHLDIVRAAVSLPELKLKNEEDMTVLFPADLMSYGLGSEVIIEVSGFEARPEPQAVESRNRLAKSLGEAVEKRFPKAVVDCHMYPFNPKHGFWSSNQNPKPKKKLPKAKLLGRSVADLAISLRTENALRAENIAFIGDVTKLSEAQLFKILHSRKGVTEVRRALEVLSLALVD